MPVITARTVIGMDIGKKYSWCEAISTETGEIFKEQRLHNQKEAFYSFLEDLPRPVRLVMEATGNWQYLYECWEGLADEIQLAHPLKTKAIASARIKTDRIDDGILAHLGEVEQTDLFGKSGLAWLATLEIREPCKSLLDQDLKILEVLRQEIKIATRTIESLGKEDSRVNLLLPIRGIGKYSAMLILAEIGDVHRFPDEKKLISFAGLCPSTFQSGRVYYHGKITKQGSKWLRWILVEAAQHYAKAPGRLGRLFRRIARRKGSKTARVAVAREILVCIYHCLNKGVAFEENPRGVRKDVSQHAPRDSGR